MLFICFRFRKDFFSTKLQQPPLQLLCREAESTLGHRNMVNTCHILNLQARRLQMKAHRESSRVYSYSRGPSKIPGTMSQCMRGVTFIESGCSPSPVVLIMKTTQSSSARSAYSKLDAPIEGAQDCSPPPKDIW